MWSLISCQTKILTLRFCKSITITIIRQQSGSANDFVRKEVKKEEEVQEEEKGILNRRVDGKQITWRNVWRKMRKSEVEERGWGRREVDDEGGVTELNSNEISIKIQAVPLCITKQQSFRKIDNTSTHKVSAALARNNLLNNPFIYLSFYGFTISTNLASDDR